MCFIGIHLQLFVRAYSDYLRPYLDVWSKGIPVNVGQTTLGNTYLEGNEKWVINGTNQATGMSTVLNKKVFEEVYSTGYYVLEAYLENANQCNAYPPQAQLFDNILVYQNQTQVANPTWTTNTKDNDCNEHATGSNGQVTIHFS